MTLMGSINSIHLSSFKTAREDYSRGGSKESDQQRNERDQREPRVVSRGSIQI